MTPELRDILKRLEKLESQLAELTREPVEGRHGRTVVAQNFLVTDKQGVRRAELGMSVPAGQTEGVAWPWLGLFDAEENVRVCMGVGGEGTSGPIEGAWLELHNENGKVVLEIEADRKQTIIRLFDSGGEPRLALSIDPSNEPSVIMSDGVGKASVSVGLLSKSPCVLMHDADGKPAVKLAIESEGPRLIMVDNSGHDSAELVIQNDGPIFRLGKDGKLLWSVP